MGDILSLSVFALRWDQNEDWERNSFSLSVCLSVCNKSNRIDRLLRKNGARLAAVIKPVYVSYYNVMLQQQTGMPTSF